MAFGHDSNRGESLIILELGGPIIAWVQGTFFVEKIEENMDSLMTLVLSINNLHRNNNLLNMILFDIFCNYVYLLTVFICTVIPPTTFPLISR